MNRGGREVCSWTDYILGIDSCLLHNTALQDARHNKAHYLVMGFLCRSPPAAHYIYLRKRTHLPMRLPATPDRIYCMFAKLQRDITSKPRKERPRQAWISPETWSFINTRIVVHRRKDQQTSGDLIRIIKEGLHRGPRFG